MALNDESGISVSMPVAPMNGYGGGWGFPSMPVMAYGNNNGFGNDFMGYFLMLFLFAAMGGGFGGLAASAAGAAASGTRSPSRGC